MQGHIEKYTTHSGCRGVLRSIVGGIVVQTGLASVEEVSAQGLITVTAVWTDDEEENVLVVVDYIENETGLDITCSPRDSETLLTETVLNLESPVEPYRFAHNPVARVMRRAAFRRPDREAPSSGIR